MIGNQTVLSEADQDFIRALLRKNPKVIAARILVLLAGAYLIFAGGVVMYAQFRWHDRSIIDIFWGIVMLAIGLFFFYSILFLKQTARRRDRKAASLSAPRSYTADENGISVQYSVNGVNTSAQYAYTTVECFWAAEHAVFLRVHGTETKQKLYMCFHDDGYSEGSRTELIALLESRGIRRMQK